MVTERRNINQIIRKGKELPNLRIEDRYITLESESEKIERDLKELEKEDILDMRKKWSDWVLFCVVLIVAWDAIVIGLIGIGWLQFKNDNIILHFLIESVIKLFGLAIIIVNFLFPKNKK